MQRMMYLLLFASAVAVGLLGLMGRSQSGGTSVHVAIALGALLLFVVLVKNKYESARIERRREAELRLVHNTSLARREAKAKIPKNSPRRDSDVLSEGVARLSSVRSMAALIRKPALRATVLDICEFADLVLETIRRMPTDTPASLMFIRTHLVRLESALLRTFELYRHPEYKKFMRAGSSDAYEVECFTTFITAFCRQQDCILTEGRSATGSGHGGTS